MVPAQPTAMMNAECWWPYGSTEQNVWEGIGTKVELAAGTYTATLTSSTDVGTRGRVEYKREPELLAFADRALDVLLLTQNSSDTQMRLRHAPLVLPLDGLLTQGGGEVFFRVHNENHSHGLNLTIPFVLGHSIYYDTHLRMPIAQPPPPNAAPGTPPPPPTDGCNHMGAGSMCPVIRVAAGDSSDWVDVGGLMDTFNHGQWIFEKGAYTIEVGVPATTAAHGATSHMDDPTTHSLPAADNVAIDTIGNFSSGGSALYLLFDENTRGSRRMRAQTADVYEVGAAVDAQTWSATFVPGRLPQIQNVPFYGDFFDSTATTYGGVTPQEPAICPGCGSKYEALYQKLDAMFGIVPNSAEYNERIVAAGVGYLDIRQFVAPYQPEAMALALNSSNATADPHHLLPWTDTERASIRVVSLGDEISVGSPVPTDIDNVSFARWASAQGLSPQVVGCSAWGASCLPDAVTVPKGVGATAGARGMFYYANKFLHDMGIAHFQRIVAIIQPNAFCQTH
eukprot:COSAG05_NODE_608_length_8372_cov_2.996615_2_plen_509_part_00